MTKRSHGRRGAWVGASIAFLLAAGAVRAEDNPTSAVKPNAASNSSVVGAGSGSGGGSPNTVVDPANGGVAGTGMGKMTTPGTGAGTGNSVKGPAGQGISNGSDTNP